MITVALATLLLMGGSQPVAAQATRDPHPGQLTIMGKDGRAGALCPLEKTRAHADIDGFGARVTVVQTFTNPSPTAIEAVYTFPLPHDAAVDRMRMKVGDRIIEGQIKRREEARQVYEEAKAAGQAAALLDQERPNIFTQSVANILPNAKIEVEISYVQILKFEEGEFEFTFPMVVGPRYTANAPDPGKIAPPITPKGTRTGANIELTVDVANGSKASGMRSALHAISTDGLEDGTMRVRLARKHEIPNRDFILKYSLSTNDVRPVLYTHRDKRGGYFTLILMPPKAPTAQQISPKEIIFVMDQSGSQSGFPIEKSKELTLKMIRTMRPRDTFNVIGFNTSTRSLWPEPRPNTPQNVAEAEKFVSTMQAGGGTHVREGVIAALEGQNDPGRLRIVLFNTDGYVGDEKLILDTIQKRRGSARMFTFGIGNSVNRFLIDAMSVEGRGDVEYVTISDMDKAAIHGGAQASLGSGDGEGRTSADEAVDRFIRRLETPVLTDVSVQFQGVQVEQLMPSQIPDVFSEKPVVIYGRYRTPGEGTVTLSGNLGGVPWSQEIDVSLPAQSEAPSVPTLWARRKIDAIQRQNWIAGMEGKSTDQNAIVQQITQVALDYGIMSEYTSFVAVEQRVINVGGRQRTVQVPVEMADGVSYEGIFGAREEMANRRFARRSMPVLGQTRGGLGGGGLGGAAAATGKAAKGKTLGVPPPAAGPATLGTVLYDAADNSIVLREKSMKPAEKRQFRYETKIEPGLRAAKGKVEVEVWVAQVDETMLKALHKLGLTVAASDKGLKVVFGTCDASRLIEIAQLDAVRRVRKLR